MSAAANIPPHQSARVIALPRAAAEPVVNRPRRGRLPASIPTLASARGRRSLASYEAEEHAKKQRALRESIANFEDILARRRQERFRLMGAQEMCMPGEEFS
jgi:hypothetical protein